MKIDKILVPLDGSPLAESALSTAVDLVREHPDATVILLRAAEARTLPSLDLIEAQASVIREAEEYLNAVAGRLRAAGISLVRTSVWYGAAASAIVEAARIQNADLIVMSTHGRRGIGRLILGSVAETVLRDTRTPVLLVRAGGTSVETPPETASPPAKEEVNV